MKVKSLPFSQLKLTYYDSETEKPPILFCHANGYSAGCYQFYHKALQDRYRVLALDFAGHGKSEMSLNFENWYFFRDQILTLLDHEKIEKITTIGHSLGGASSLLASVKQPSRFERLIVWDPVILGFKLILLSKIFGNPLARGAAKRRSKFNSLELVRRSYKKFPAFSSFDPEIYEDYLSSCFRRTEKGEEVELCCDPRVETRIFTHSHFHVFLNFFKIQSETHVIIPKNYEVCSPSLARLLTKKNKKSSITIWDDATHFFPFEKPKATLQWLNGILER